MSIATDRALGLRLLGLILWRRHGKSVIIIALLTSIFHRMYNHYYDCRQRYLRRDFLSITLTIAVSIPQTFRCKLLPVSWGRAPRPPCHVGCRTFLPRIAQLEAALHVLTKLPRWVRRA